MDKKIITFFNFANLNYGGGCEKNFMKLGHWFSEQGYEVNFVTASSRLNNITSFFIRSDKYGKNISDRELIDKFKVKNYHTFDLKDLWLPTKKRKIIKDLLYSSDVILSKNEIFEVFLLKSIFRIDSKNIVFGFHTPIYYPIRKSVKSRLHNLLYNSRFYSFLLGKSYARCLVLTEFDKDILKKMNSSWDIKVIPNPMDTDRFSKKIFKKEKKFKVYYIGRMTEQKGIDILYNSIIELSSHKEFKNLEFYFVGSGEEEHYLIELSKRYKNCHYLGFQTEVLKYYHDADITVVPSRWEGFPYAVLEAQSTATPVITTDTAGCRDIVVNKKYGWIIPQEDYHKLSLSILGAYDLWKDDYPRFRSIGYDARKNIVLNYNEEKINGKIERFLFK